jgi:hypothetical protein
MRVSTEKEVLVSITTYHGQGVSDGWKAMLAEVADLGLNRVALFITGLDHKSRLECYSILASLKQRQNLSLPFVHARADMQPEEYHWLMEEMGTQVFNLHTPSFLYPHPLLPAELKQRICLENSCLTPDRSLTRSSFDGFAGICLDLSHLEDARRRHPQEYLGLIDLLTEIPVCANHISAIPNQPRSRDLSGKPAFDDHRLLAECEIDYAATYPPNYFGQYVALELINPIREQLFLAKRLRDLINEDYQQIRLAA